MKRIHDPSALQRWLKQLNIEDWFEDPSQINFQLTAWEKGEYLCVPPAGLTEFIFCVKGAVQICSFSENGKGVLLSDHEAPYFLGAMEFLQPHIEQHYTIASQPLLGVTFSIEQNRQLLQNSLRFHQKLCMELSSKLLNSSSSRKEQSLYTLDERLLNHLQLVAKADGSIASSWVETAQLMDVSYRHLMHTLQQFCARGILTHGARRGEYTLSPEYRKA